MKVSVAKNKSIEITVKNGRELLLRHNIDTVKITKDTRSNKILNIDFYGKNFCVGSNVEVNILESKHNYFITLINQIDQYTFELICEPLTKSSIFLMPLVTEKGTFHDLYFYNTYLYNAYINFTGLDEFNDNNHLFLVYRFFISDYFKNLENYISQHKNFVKTYEPNREFTVYIMEIPLIFQKDARMILRGKYSNISATAKSKIISFHKAHIESELSHILHKSSKLKEELEQHLGCNIPEDIELHSKPELIKETFIW